jgi:hypothetical protein
MWYVLERGEVYEVFVIKLNERDHFEDLGLDVSWVLKWIFMK